MVRTAWLAMFLALGCSACAPSRQGAVRPDTWQAEIRAFEVADRESPPPQGAVLFIGSSSIRLWKNLAEDFPHTNVINRGFGGSCIPDCTRHIEQIVVPYRPRLVVLYAGDNDVAAGRTARQVFGDYREFVHQVRRRLPRVPIAFISIKPSPSRLAYLEVMREANGLIRGYAAKHSGLIYIDVFSRMLGPDGKPRPELFGADRLHMNREGYELWKAIIAACLQQMQPFQG